MRYEDTKKLSDSEFKRAVGIKRETFLKLVKVLSEYKTNSRKYRDNGRRNKLTFEDILLLMLSYHRDYTTCFKLGIYYGLSEGAVSRNIRWAEKALASSGLLEIKETDKEESDYVIIDATEISILKPKKNSVGGIQESEKDIR